MLLPYCLSLTNTLCTGRGNHQVSPPPAGPSACCCGVHLVQTFKAQMPGGVPVDFATDRGLGATRVSGMLLPRCCPVLQGRGRRTQQKSGAQDIILAPTPTVAWP